MTNKKQAKPVKIAVVCRNASGFPDVFVTTVMATEGQVEAGDHYDLAIEKAEDEGYEGVGRDNAMIPFDHHEFDAFHRVIDDLYDPSLDSEVDAIVSKLPGGSSFEDDSMLLISMVDEIASGSGTEANNEGTKGQVLYLLKNGMTEATILKNMGIS